MSLEDDTPEEKEEVEASAILLMFFLLTVTIWIGHLLRKWKIKWMHETGAAIVLGALVGGVLSAMRDTNVEEVVAFSQDFFFLFLLPPIIFDSGYNMKRGAFFNNIGAILAFAFVGTLVSTLFIGGILSWMSSGGLFELTRVESFVFGALISATDPVTVLAVFTSLHVDVNLYSLVFGESVLNDAVAIVMYRTVLEFREETLTVSSVFRAFGLFLGIFLGSFSVGVAFGLLCALVLKHTDLRNNPVIEVSMLFLFAYMSYLVAEASGLSGIVAILFCGITMAHYCYVNLSAESKAGSSHTFHTIAFLAETFVFVYLGLSLFIFRESYHWGLIITCTLLCLLARAVHVYPLTWLINRVRGASTSISPVFQLVVWYSGLRGAIAFALALEVPTAHETTITTTTLMIVFFTVLVLGGGVQPLLNHYNLSMYDHHSGPPATAHAHGGALAEWIYRMDTVHVLPFFTHVRAPPRRDVYGDEDAGGDFGDVALSALPTHTSTPSPRERTSSTTGLSNPYATAEAAESEHDTEGDVEEDKDAPVAVPVMAAGTSVDDEGDVDALGRTPSRPFTVWSDAAGTLPRRPTMGDPFAYDL